MKNKIRYAVLLTVLIAFAAGYCQGYRDSLLKPEALMDSIGVRPGMVVGEAGAGRGYFTFKLAGRVGATGLIYANDIDDSALKAIKSKCRDEDIGNIRTVKGRVADPRFPVNDLDMVFMIAAFHDFTEPVAWLKNVQQYMKAEATLVIVEKDPDRWGRSWDHHMTRTEILEALAEGGFQIVSIDSSRAQDNIYISRIARSKNEKKAY